jgi:hypothetical protein
MNSLAQKKGHPHPTELDTRDILQLLTFGELSLPPKSVGAKTNNEYFLRCLIEGFC